MEPSACPSHGLKTPALYKARDSNILRPSGGQLTAEKMYPKGPEGPKIWFIENKQDKAHLSQNSRCCGPWLEIFFGDASSDGESVSSTVFVGSPPVCRWSYPPGICNDFPAETGKPTSSWPGSFLKRQRVSRNDGTGAQAERIKIVHGPW
jgi:hypothetical protein